MEILMVKIETIAQMWFEFMVASSVQLAIFIVFVSILTLLFRKQSAKFLYWIWLIGLLKIFVPPSIKLPDFLSQSKLVLDNTIPTIVFPEIRLTTLPAPGISYQGYLFLLWTFVLFLLVAFWVFKMLRFGKAITRSCYEATEKILAIHSFDTRNRIRFFTGTDITMPFTKGLFSPKIYLPESALIWSGDELKALIFHELAHIKRKDILIISIQNIIQLFYFFHPLVWLANIKISRYREKACDDFAIHAMQGKYVEYSKLLLKSINEVVGWQPIPSLNSYFHQSKKFLINRFEYILNRRELIMTKLNSIQKMVLVGLMLLGIVFSCHKKDIHKQPLESITTSDRSIDYSKTALQSGLVDSQKVDYDTPPMPVGGFEAIEKLLTFPESYKKYGVIFNVKIDENGEPKTIFMKVPPKTPYPDSYREGYFDGRINGLFARIKWTPAIKNGKPIAAWITLPLKYSSQVVAKEMVVPPPPPPLSGEEDVVFVAYDEPPEPIGGFAAIQRNLVYPELARKAGIEGTVIVQAQISESGEVNNTRISQSLGETNGCNEAAIEAIKSVKWKPAKQKGKPVAVWVSIPVRFKLAKVKKEKQQEPKIIPPPILKPDDEEKLFVPYDEPPEPIGGFAAIQKNLIYPELARKAGIEGTVTVQAQIGENGDVVATRIHVPLGESGCNEAAVEAIKSVKWKPAQAKGQPVAVWVSVPVRFRLH